MKIQLNVEQCYSMTIGTAKHIFTVASEWNGLKELRNAQGDCLIVSTGDHTFAALFPMLSNATDAVVIGGSPDLLAQLKG